VDNCWLHIYHNKVLWFCNKYYWCSVPGVVMCGGVGCNNWRCHVGWGDSKMCRHWHVNKKLHSWVSVPYVIFIVI